VTMDHHITLTRADRNIGICAGALEASLPYNARPYGLFGLRHGWQVVH